MSKTRITAWDALVWAYAHENVRAIGGSSDSGPAVRLGSGTMFAMLAMENRHSANGTVRGFLTAHEDAIAIEAFVQESTRGDPEQYLTIVRAAERRAPVPASLDLPPQRCVPVMITRKGVEVPKIIYSPKGKPLICCVDIEGVPEAEIAKAQRQQANLHSVFLALLDVMEARLSLTRWHIVGRGLTDRGESLTTGRRMIIVSGG